MVRAKVLSFVMAGLDPAIPLRKALHHCVPKRDHQVKPGDDAEERSLAFVFAVIASETPPFFERLWLAM